MLTNPTAKELYLILVIVAAALYSGGSEINKMEAVNRAI
jgi:hypothetical protein